MKSVRWPMTLAFLSAGLFLIAFLFVTLLVGARIGFLYSRVPGFSIARSVGLWAGMLAALGFFTAAIIATGAVAMLPASWPRKLLAVIPVLLVLFALAGLISALLGIGTVGNVGVLPVLGPVTFASAWLALGTVLAVLATVIAVATGTFSARAWLSSALAMGVTSLAGVVTAVAMVGMLIIVANNQPSLRPFNNPGGSGGEGQIAPAAGAGQGNAGGETGLNSSNGGASQFSKAAFSERSQSVL